LTVHLPTDSHSSDDDTYFNDLEEENNVAEEEESCNGDPIGVNDMENDGHSTRHPENKDISISYDDLQEHHYQYDPNHYHDDDHCYYKGFQHLCCLRKPIPLSNDPYDAVSSQKRFTDQAFHQVFGAKIDHSSTSNVNTATTHVLNRFDDDTSGENPIVGIKYDALSQSIVDTIIGIANTREFLKDQAGKYIRAATTEPCQGYRVPCFPDSEEYSQCDRMYPLFRIGQKEDSNARLFMGIAATPEETHLLDLVNKFSEHVLGGSVSYDHNFMMMSVSNIEKSFGAHSDHSLWHGKVDVNCPYISKNGLPLRSESEAYTLTMCINKSQTTKKLVEISWYDKTKADADNPHGKLLHQCVTRANTIHFQFPGSQANGVVHAGDWVENSEWDEPTDFEEHAEQCDQDDEDWRIVVSFRQNVSSSSCPACYLKRFDLLKMHGCELIGRKPDDWWTSILDSIEQGVEPEKCHMDSINNGPINQIHQAHAQEKPESEPDMNNKKKYFLNHFKNRDQYKNCSQEEVKKYDIPIQDTYICEEACLSDTYNTYDYIRAMLKNCIVPNISYQMEEASSARKKKNKVVGAVDITNTGEENVDMSYKPVTGKASKRERKTTIEEFPPLLYHSRGKTKGREYFKRDRVYPLDTVLNCAKINWSKKMDKQQELKPPMRTEDWRIFNTFICHRKYKNSKSSLIEFFTNPTCRWVDVIGSGGSPSKMDKNGADWDSVLKDKQDVAHLPHSQPMNDMNSTIIQAAQNNRTVAVFIGKEVYDYVWDDKRMKSLLNSGMKKVPLSKDNLYFLGYFHCIKQHSKKGMEHSELVEEAEGETSIDTQRLMRFREMPYFRLTLELIPDKLLDILPVRDDKNKNKLVHHGGSSKKGRKLKEVLVKYDPHERIRYPADRQNISRYLLLGIEKEISNVSEVVNNTDDANENVNEKKIPEDENVPDTSTQVKHHTRSRRRRDTDSEVNKENDPEANNDSQQDNKIKTVTRMTLLKHHIETEIMGNSMVCRDVPSYSTHVKNRDDLPQPVFKKVFCSHFTHDDHLWLLDTRKKLSVKQSTLKVVLKHTGLDSIIDDPEWQDFTYGEGEQDKSTTMGSEELGITSVKWCKDLMSRTRDEMVKMKEVAESMVFVSAGVLYRSMRKHIDNGLACPLSNRCVGSKIQLYPTKSPNSILDMGRFSLRNELVRELQCSSRDELSSTFKTYTPKEGVRDPLFLDYCFKSIILTFNGRPSVISNYFIHAKNEKGGAIPSPDEVDTFITHLSLNQKHGTTDGGIFNQQWSVCPELNCLCNYKEFIMGYASIHKERFYKEVMELSMDNDGNMDRKMVLDNWVKLAASGYHNGAGTTLKFRFHIHQAMLNIENVFGRVFGEETLDSVCVYHGSKEGWNKLRMNDEVSIMKSLLPKSKKRNKDDVGVDTQESPEGTSNRSKKGPQKRTVRLDDDSIKSMSDLMSNSEYEHLMSYFKNLTKEELSVMLIEKDENGVLRNMVNHLSIGPSFLEHVLCILQYYLRRLSSGYNVSQRNEFDRPNFQPLKFNSNNLMFTKKNDPFLWELIESGINTFEKWAGKGTDWKDVLYHPPDLFMIEEELELIYNARNKKKSSQPKKKENKKYQQQKTNKIRESIEKNTKNLQCNEAYQQQVLYNTRAKKGLLKNYE
jgi:hypothetical protein